MRAFQRDEGGQAIIVAGITMLAMIFAVGLAIDTGQLFVGRRGAQEAADSAAFAGAVVIYQGGTTSQATSAATSDASLNGYATNTPTSGTTVTAVSPPSSGSYSGTSGCVQVTISTPVKTSLVPQQSLFTTVVATAVGCSTAFSGNYAVMALDTSCTSKTLQVGSNGDLKVQGGGIQVNSCANDGAYMNNGSSVTLESGYNTDVSGSAANGSWPSLRTSRSAQADPFGGLTKPSTTGLTVYTDPSCSPTINQPGIYTGNTSSSCDTYIFAPGTYILKGAKINSNGNSDLCTGNPVSTTSTTAVGAGTVTVTPSSMTNIVVGKGLIVGTGSSKETVTVTAITGTTFTAKFGVSHSGTWSITGGCASASPGDGGVTFFVTSTAYPSSGTSCQDVKFNGNGSTNMYASTSGTYQGLLIWVDSDCSTDVRVGGNGTISGAGTIYVPNGKVYGDGNNSAIYVSQIVAKKLDEGNADFTMNYDKSVTYQGKFPALVD